MADKEERLRKELRKLKKEADKRGVSVKELLSPTPPIEKLKETAEERNKSIGELISEGIDELLKAVEQGKIDVEELKRQRRKEVREFDKEAKKN